MPSSSLDSVSNLNYELISKLQSLLQELLESFIAFAVKYSVKLRGTTESNQLNDRDFRQLWPVERFMPHPSRPAIFATSNTVIKILYICSRIIRLLVSTFKLFIKKMYWLLAPHIMFKLSWRHCILFFTMFFTPTIYRQCVHPIIRYFRFQFLRITMGNDWLTKYKALLAKCHYETGDCKTFAEYAKVAQQLDEMDGLYEWRINRQSKLYSHDRIHQDLLQLHKLIQICQEYLIRQEQLIYERNMSNSDNDSVTIDSHSHAPVPSRTRSHPLRDLMEFLRSRINRNYCGISNEKMYNITRIGTKKMIEDFIDNMCQALIYVCEFQDPMVTIEEKLVFFNELRHISSRSALCLSGGGGFGIYHWGVIACLLKHKIVPRVITGSSAGSIIGAIVATFNEEELFKLIYNVDQHNIDIRESNFPDWKSAFYHSFRRIYQTGNMLDVNFLGQRIRQNFGDLTFLEAYQKTGRILNITVTGTDANTIPRLLNFLSSPNVVIWSACLASCAIPNVFEAQELLVKEYIDPTQASTSLPQFNAVHTAPYTKPTRTDTSGFGSNYHLRPAFLQGVMFKDGSLAHDLPMNRLQQLFNIDNFIVSQVNPHILPFLSHTVISPFPFFNRLFRFLSSEFYLYSTSIMVALREFGILKGMSILNGLIEQRYTGDVTILPNMLWSEAGRFLSNATPEFIKRAIKTSERTTWRHLNRLQALLAVEICLDECLTTLRTLANRKQSALYLSSLNNQMVHGGNRVEPFMHDSNHLHIMYGPGTGTAVQTLNINRNNHNRFGYDANHSGNEGDIINSVSEKSSFNTMPKVMSVTELCSDIAVM